MGMVVGDGVRVGCVNTNCIDLAMIIWALVSGHAYTREWLVSFDHSVGFPAKDEIIQVACDILSLKWVSHKWGGRFWLLNANGYCLMASVISMV